MDRIQQLIAHFNDEAESQLAEVTRLDMERNYHQSRYEAAITVVKHLTAEIPEPQPEPDKPKRQRRTKADLQSLLPDELEDTKQRVREIFTARSMKGDAVLNQLKEDLKCNNGLDVSDIDNWTLTQAQSALATMRART